MPFLVFFKLALTLLLFAHKCFHALAEHLGFACMAFHTCRHGEQLGLHGAYGRIKRPFKLFFF